MIPFNKPPRIGNEERFVLEAIESPRIAGDGVFSRQCQAWFEAQLPCQKALLTPSCTHALEMAAILINIQPGDEVIMPSYTFVSTANAFVLRGAKIVFVDIRPDTMNIDETLIEAAITPKTKAIVPVHYAGVGCEMDIIMELAEKYELFVIEDAAQAMTSTYKGRTLGTIGHLGAYSFHETKNYTSGGEGGLLIINDERFVERAEIIREKGTNRSQFFRGEVDKYSWVDIGSSYLPSELQAAYLYAQLLEVSRIKQERMRAWNYYFTSLSSLQEEGHIVLPELHNDKEQNAHIFYLKLKDIAQRTKFIDFLRAADIFSVFHYVPLHSSEAGLKYGRFEGDDIFTTTESERLVRLPMYFDLNLEDQIRIIAVIYDFFEQ